MLSHIHYYLVNHAVLLLFLILGLGYLLGRIRIGKSFELGPVSGVLFVGLIFGHFGYQLSPTVQSLGFVLFIFSVGFQSEPKFFAVLLKDGMKYLALALVIGTTGFLLALGLSKIFGFSHGSAAGLLAGGMTSSPTLAAAQEAVHSGAYTPPSGIPVNEVLTSITASYAITYIFGLVGLILIIGLLPRILHIDLPAEAAKLADDGKAGFDGDQVNSRIHIEYRAYQLTNPIYVGMNLREVHENISGRITVHRLKRAGQFVEVNEETVFHDGDLVSVSGYLSEFMVDMEKEIGPEIDDTDLRDLRMESIPIVVTQSDAIGITFKELGVTEHYGCFVSVLQRVGVEILIEPNVSLERGDVLTVTEPKTNVDMLGKRLGHIERSVPETDLLTFALAIAAGILVGTITIPVFGVSIGIGSAGGLLAAGLGLGFLHSVYPTFGRVPPATRWIFIEMGLLIFMAGVGLRAGGGIVETVLSVGPTLFLCGAIVTTVPILLGYLFGRKILGINPVLLLGAITGSMTSGASLSIVNKEAKSTVPALGYTGAYAFANVILTIAGSLILRL